MTQQVVVPHKAGVVSFEVPDATELAGLPLEAQALLLTGDVVLGPRSAGDLGRYQQILDPNGTPRNVDLPASSDPNSAGLCYLIDNVGAQNLVVRDGGAATVLSIPGGDKALLALDPSGPTWRATSFPAAAGSSVPVGVNRIRGGAATSFPDITSALATAVAGDVVLVGPGTYAESITIPDQVYVLGFPAARSVVITGADATSPRVTLAGTSTIREVTVTSPSSGANPAIDASGLIPGNVAVVFNIVIQGTGAGSGILGAGTGILAVLGGIYHNGGTLTGPLIDAAGGSLVVQQLIANVGVSSAVCRVAPGAIVEARDWLAQPNSLYSCTDLITMSGGELYLNGLANSRVAPAATNAIHITAGPVKLEVTASRIFGSSFDLLVDPTVNGSGSELEITAADFRQELASAPAIWADNLAVGLFNYADVGINNDPVVRSGGAFAVSAFVRPAPSYFGGGADITQGMTILSDDGLGNFVDNTAAAKSRSGSTFALLQGTAAGNIAYFGISFAQFPALHVDVVTPFVPTTDFRDGVWEYFNGSSWVTVAVMSSTFDARSQHCSQVFQRAGQEYNRFDLPSLVAGGWVATAVNGITAFWLRWRLVNPVVTVPVLERVLITPSRAEAAASGFLQFFGTSEGTLPLLVHQRLTDDLQGASPANGQLDISTDVDITPLDNQFNSGQDDGFGLVVSIPIGLDTSRALSFRVGWIPTSTGTGTVAMRAYVANPITVGTNINSGAVAQQELVNADTQRPSGSDQTGAVPEIDAASNGELYVTEYNFTIADAEPGTFFGLSLIRKSSSVGDTYAGNVRIAFVELDGTRWRL